MTSRLLHSVEHPSDQSRHLTQQSNALTTENYDNVAVSSAEPKFLGFCCGPAASCCCGCSLHFALKAFATIALVLGVLGLMGFLVSVGMTDVWKSFESLIRCGLLLALGISLWNTAGDVNPRLGQFSSSFLAGIYTLDVVMVIFTIIILGSPSSTVVIYVRFTSQFNDRLMKELSSEFIGSNRREPTPNEMESLQMLAKALVNILIGSLITVVTFEGLLFLLAFYFIWSFIVRAKRGEYFLLAFGPHSLPTPVPHSVTSRYGAYYPQPISEMQPNQQQQQPVMYPPPQYSYPHQGSHDMQPVPYAQPAPQAQ